ncbi:MAG: diguanylate cyclase [Myxococcota bacterium]
MARRALAAWVILLASASVRAETIPDQLSAIRETLRTGSLNDALTQAEAVVVAAEREGDAEQLADALRVLGSVLVRLNRYDDAEPILKRALAIVEPMEPGLVLGRTYLQMARLQRFRADYIGALEWAHRAEQCFGTLRSDSDLQTTYSFFGVIYDVMGQLEQSLEWHRKGLSLARKLDDTSGVAGGLYAIGEVHRTLRDTEQALKYFKDALEFDLASGDVGDQGHSYVKIGVCHRELGQFGRARKSIQRAYELFSGAGMRRNTQWAASELASIDFREGKSARALETLTGILGQTQSEGWPRLENQVRLELAKIHLSAGDYDSSLEQIETVLDESMKQRSMRRTLDALELQANVLEAAERYDEALATFKKRYEVEHQISESMRESAIATLQSEAEFEAQAVALELAQKERQIASLALEREEATRFNGLVTLLVVLTVALLVIGRIAIARQNAFLTREVAAKTQELRKRNAELEEAYAAVDEASVTDPLTGLANRRFLERHIATDTSHSIRQHQEGSTDSADLVFFLLDIDHFKTINDRHGHAIGDKVLFELSRLLEHQFRKGDILVRWGGEEFLVVARFIHRDTAPLIAERVRRAIEAHEFERPRGPPLRCTCSIGFAPFPFIPERSGDVSWEEVVEMADEALYSVKQGPRNGWAGYFAPQSIAPVRPVSSWIPSALQTGALETIRSF